MEHYHAVVWIDHKEARVFHITEDEADEIDVHPHGKHHKMNLHHKAGSVSGKRSKEDEAYYHEVVEALGNAQEILVLGHGMAKTHLMKHMHSHDPKVADRVIGIETVDHPTNPQIVAYAREYFKRADRMLPQT